MCFSRGGNAYEVVLLRALWGPDNRLRSDGDYRAADLSACLIVCHRPLLAFGQISSCLPVEPLDFHLSICFNVV